MKSILWCAWIKTAFLIVLCLAKSLSCTKLFDDQNNLKNIILFLTYFIIFCFSWQKWTLCAITNSQSICWV